MFVRPKNYVEVDGGPPLNHYLLRTTPDYEIDFRKFQLINQSRSLGLFEGGNGLVGGHACTREGVDNPNTL